MIDLMQWAMTVRADSLTMGERFAELLTINGGNTNIVDFGTSTKSDANRYKRVGLTVPEALEFASLTGQVKLLQAYNKNQIVAFSDLMKRIIGDSAVLVAGADFLKQLKMGRM